MKKMIPGFEQYSVMQDGRVFGPRTELRPSPDKRGYLRVWVYNRGIRTEIYVHRAVALAWVDGDQSLTVNHIDGNKLNNMATNLEWISLADNLRHSFRIGTHSPHHNKRGTITAFSQELREAMFNEIRMGRSIRATALHHGVGVKTLQYQYKMNGVSS